MELLKLPITAGFVRERTDLTWREALFGVDNELLAPGAAADLAAHQVAGEEAPSPALVELAGVSAGEEARALVETLARASAEQAPEAVQAKWLYLALAWVFEHRAGYPEPLRTVEEIYADFGYPEEIASFVRYMPTTEPDLGSPEANEGRLIETWRLYLEAASQRHGALRAPRVSRGSDP